MSSKTNREQPVEGDGRDDVLGVSQGLGGDHHEHQAGLGGIEDNDDDDDSI